MRNHQSVLFLLGIIAFAAILPAWVWFIHSHPTVSDLSIEMQFLADASLPLVALMFVSSWVGGGS